MKDSVGHDILYWSNGAGDLFDPYQKDRLIGVRSLPEDLHKAFYTLYDKPLDIKANAYLIELSPVKKGESGFLIGLEYEDVMEVKDGLEKMFDRSWGYGYPAVLNAVYDEKYDTMLLTVTPYVSREEIKRIDKVAQNIMKAVLEEKTDKEENDDFDGR